MTNREEVREALTGPIASQQVPFTKDGEIDYKGLVNLIDFPISAGNKTVLLTYGDSLFSVLTDQEVAEITKFTVAHTAGRAMVVAADRQWWTGKTIEFAKYAREVGADMLMVLPPNWAASCTSETLITHYSAVAEHIPVMVVTNLFRDVEAFGLKTLETLRDKTDNVMAVKDDVGEEFARKLCGLVKSKWAVFSGGRMQSHLNMLPYGCDGFMSPFQYFRPSVDYDYWNATQKADWNTAVGIINEFEVPFFGLTTQFDGGFNAIIHGVLELFGLSERWRRPPYHSLIDEDMDRLYDFFKSQGWL